MDTSPTIATLITALLEAKKGFSPVIRGAKNPHFGNRYADLQTVLDAVEKPLLDNGLVLTQPTGIGEAGPYCDTYLIHTSGEWIKSSYPLVPVKNDPQGFGSALTYARRYQALALLGLAPEDDDGNDASRPAEARGEPSGSGAPERTEAPRRDFAAEATAATDLDKLRDIQRAAAAAGEWVAESDLVQIVLARKTALEHEQEQQQ